MLPAAGVLQPDNGLDVLCQAEAVDVGLPVIDAVVFGCRSEFEVLGHQVDDAIVGVAVVVAAGGGVGVVVGADPPPGVHGALQSPADLDRLAWPDFDRLLQHVELGPTGNSDQIVPRGELLGETAVVGVVLVVAAVSPVGAAQVGRGGAVAPDELNLARRRLARLVPDVELDPGRRRQLEIQPGGPPGSHRKASAGSGCLFPADVDDLSVILPRRQLKVKVALRIGIGRQLCALKFHQHPGMNRGCSVLVGGGPGNLSRLCSQARQDSVSLQGRCGYGHGNGKLPLLAR